MKKSNLKFLPYIHVVAGGLVGGIVVAVSGSLLQSGIAGIATGFSVYTATALASQSQSTKQKLLEQQLEILNKDLERQKKALGSVAELDILQQKREYLVQELQDLNKSREDLEIRLASIQKAASDLESLEQRRQESSALKAQIDEKLGQLKAVQQQISEREQQRDRLQPVTEQYLKKQAEVQEVTDKLRELNNQTAELELARSHYDVLTREYANISEQKQHLQAEIPRLQQEHDRIQAAILEIEPKAQETSRLRREIHDLEAVLRAKQSARREIEFELERLDAERVGLGDNIARRQQELKDLQEKIRVARGELEDIENSTKYAFQALEAKVDVPATSPHNFNNESDFLTGFKQYLNEKGLVFPERTINAFHTSLKVQDISALVILAGISGTGKSELPQAYAEFSGVPLVMLPVQPRWDSPQDLQGFYNYIEKKYKPTELMHYLYQHQRDSKLQGRMVMVLLDEMNLARVEYYFSDFLSKLETRRNKPTYLDLEAGSLKLQEGQKKVRIPEEFLFVGTMNEDETTQSLSDKVLDRANVLTFGRPPELKLRDKNHSKPPVPTEYLPWQTFKGWYKEPVSGSPMTDQVKSYVDRANSMMEELNRPFAHRVYQAITKYVSNYPDVEHNEMLLKQAIADQFGQKLLPKLRGVMVEDTTVKPVLDKMDALLSELQDDALNQAFEKARNGQYGQFQWKGMVYQQE